MYSSEAEKEARLAAAGLRPQSNPERRAMVLVNHIFGDATIMVDVRLTAGTSMFNKATDIYVMQPFDLMIEVDGEQHFSRGFGDCPVEVQTDTDLRFNELAAANNMNLIRLHYLDEPEWGAKLLQARFLRLQVQRIDLRTSSYGRRL